MNRSKPGLPVHHHLPEFTQTHVHRVHDVIQPSHPQSSPSPIPLSIRVFSDESTLPMRWPKYWSFSFSISPSNEYSGLISFRIDWFDLLAVQDSQESSPATQFKGISSLVLFYCLFYCPILLLYCLFYCPALTSIHDYWKNHSFD